jgi:hypothetical protein
MDLRLGSDFGGVLDLETSFSQVNGRRALAEAIARRLTTPRGGLWYDPNYGYDLRQHLNSPAPRGGVIESQVTAEVLKDDRVFDVAVSVVFASEKLTVVLQITDALGPFPLIVEVTQLSVDLLTENT